MTDRATDDDDRLPTAAPPEDPAPALAAEIVLSRDGPAECTIFPPDATGVQRLTAWITAREGSFVGLDDVR